MTHDERLVRRQGMALAVESGESVGVIAKTFGVSEGVVYQACREHGVPRPRKGQPPRNDKKTYACFQVLAAWIAGQKNTGAQSRLAEEFSVSRAYVSKVLQSAREVGLIPPKKEKANV